MTMPPDALFDSESSMPFQLSASARTVADFFSRALSSFQNSGSKLQVICTAAHRNLDDHGLPSPLPPRKGPWTLIVLDSSFNPPTRAHLRMATSAIHDLTQKQGQELGRLRLLMLLSVNNADKGAKPAAFDQRLVMMWAFARDVQQSIPTTTLQQPTSGASDSQAEGLNVDLALTTVPYFHEKSRLLAAASFYRPTPTADQQQPPETEQLFLVGYDTLIRIFNPKYYPPTTLSSPTTSSPNTTATSQPLTPTPTPTPMQTALAPFFTRARLRVTLRTDDEWGGEEEQRAHLASLMQAGAEDGGGGRGHH
ncbi:hypothetical protein N0V88_007145 [Collariella sp. IMI 366227]|nr:hypothetical protein N0V88_007145 [Collariella sp. IMI 366227]